MVVQTLQKLGFSTLNPMQQKAVDAGFLSWPRALVSAPTASGKTLLALLAITKHFENSKSSVFYVVPLRALASEKYREFTQQLAAFNLKVGISTGDFDGSSEEMRGYDLVILTSEKLDSVLRHDASWLDRLGLVVVDEAHLVGDGTRGATLEVVLTKLKRSFSKLLVLSATIPNSAEFAKWLGASVFQSDWRPTPLEWALFDGDQLHFESEEPESAKGLADVVKRALDSKKKKGQALIFVSTRRSTEALARDLGKVTSVYLAPEEKTELEELSRKARKALMRPTEQCHKLADCIAQGVAFHHAGLEGKQKEVVELGFKKHRAIKLIVATTTLAVGLDLPASWVVVRDLKRYNGSFSEFLTKMECLQMAGRAGRPRYDDKGVAVLVCGKNELRKVRDKYVFGDLEDIYSQLSSEPSLRTHALGLCASGYSKSFEDLFSFFQSTFYATQYQDSAKLLSGVEKVVLELQKMDFVREKNGKLFATPLGKRVSELYLDPYSAYGFLQSMKKPLDDFSFLLAVQNASEARPLLNIRRDEERALWEEWFSRTDGEDDEFALQRFKTAKFYNAWVNEATEDEILQDFDIPPGVLHAKVRIQDWLTYSFGELAFLQNQTSAHAFARKMRRRIKHGVKEELLALTRFRGIGRVRARRLFNAGIRTSDQYEALSKDEVRRIVKA